MLFRVFFLIVVYLNSSFSLAAIYKVEVSESELQEAAVKMAPLIKKSFVFEVAITSPIIDLKQVSDRIWLTLDVEVNASKKILGNGRASFNGNVRYESKTGEFFFQDVVLEKLESQNIPERLFPKIKSMVEGLGNQVLAKKPVYKLKGDKLQDEIAKMFLKSVTVSEEKMILELEL